MKLHTLLLIVTLAASNANGSEPASKNRSIEPRTIYSKSGKLSPQHLRGFRAISEMKCKSGDSMYCLDLAKMLTEGIGGDKNPKRAATLIKKACRDGNQIACARMR